MVPVVTGLLILVAIALIAVEGLPDTLKPQPVRQLTMENFATPPPPKKKAVGGKNVFSTPTTTTKKAVVGSTSTQPIAPSPPNPAAPPPKAITIPPPKATESVPAKAEVTPVNVTPEARERVSELKMFLMASGKQKEILSLLQKYVNSTTDYGAKDFIDELWQKMIIPIESQYNKHYAKSATSLSQVFVAAVEDIASEIEKDKSFKNGKVKATALRNNIKTWRPPTKPAPPLAKAAPMPNLASKPAPAPKPMPKAPPKPTPKPTAKVVAKPAQPTNVGMNNIEGNQFSLATITLPITTSINGNTLSLSTAAMPKVTQPVPANMVESGAAPKISGGEMDRIITGLVKENLRSELENIGKADKIAATRKSTPGLSQGKEFSGKMPADYKGAKLNPNAASSKGGYNHLGPLSNYQDSYHPPLMPDGGYYDPRIYVRKDSVPCYGCSLDY